jgi:undecaprenyl-diphosphatase
VLLCLCLLALFRGGLWLWRRSGGTKLVELAVAVLVAVPLRLGSDFLKGVVESPRPTASAGLTVEHRIPSYGFPSGHVYGDVLVLGLACVFAPLWLPRRVVPVGRGALLLIIVCAGAARVYVGAHWPSDTLGGYLWGATALGLAVGAGQIAGRLAEQRLPRVESRLLRRH